MTSTRRAHLVAAAAAFVVFAADAKICSADDRADALEHGVERFRARDFAAAAAALTEAHAADPRDLEATLLLGIAYYRLEQLALAEPLLRQAAGSPDDEVATSARVFLALLAGRRGDQDSARALLRAAASSQNPTLAAAGRSLLVTTMPDRAMFALLLALGFDSNVPLLPVTSMPGVMGAASDGYLALVGSAAVRPLREHGLVLEDTASYRQYARLYAYDFFANLLVARYEYRDESDRLSARYGFETMTLGRALYALGQLGELSYRRRLQGWLGVDAGYRFSDRTYYPDGYAAYSGPTHTGSLGFSLGTLDAPAMLSIAYVLARELTVDPQFVATAQGGRLATRVAVGKRVDLALSGWLLARRFDASSRRDEQLYADASVVIALGAHLSAIAGGSALRNVSTDVDYDFTKVTAHLGLELGLGL